MRVGGNGREFRGPQALPPRRQQQRRRRQSGMVPQAATNALRQLGPGQARASVGVTIAVMEDKQLPVARAEDFPRNADAGVKVGDEQIAVYNFVHRD